jgi:dihydrofolate reductase/gamma-glutamylcyclotransferase (GGCT)/AIG2-like uncharacterized protein YtfP
MSAGSVLLFSYGTLRDPAVQRATFGRELTGRDDVLPGYTLGRAPIFDPEVARSRGETHYANVIAAGSDAAVPGAVFEITAEELAAADRYETAAAYSRVLVTLRSGARAWVYVRHRLVRFGGAMSLDGYIAGPNGEFDWILMDPDVDFGAMMAEFDTFLIGRKTFDAMRRMGTDPQPAPGVRNIIFSRTLNPADYPELIIRDDAVAFVTELRTSPGKDISLFGGGELLRGLLAAGLVDRVEVGLMPVLLGGGIPLLPSPAARTTLKLRKQRVYEKTGTIGLEYDVIRT